jgi:hypothetical protein
MIDIFNNILSYVVLPLSILILIRNLLQIVFLSKYPVNLINIRNRINIQNNMDTSIHINHMIIRNYFHLYYMVVTYFVFTISIIIYLVDTSTFVNTISNILLNICTLILLLWITRVCNYHINIWYDYCDDYSSEIKSSTVKKTTSTVITIMPSKQLIIRKNLSRLLTGNIIITFLNSLISYSLIYTLNAEYYIVLNELGIIFSIFMVIIILWYHIYKIHRHIIFVENEVTNTPRTKVYQLTSSIDEDCKDSCKQSVVFNYRPKRLTDSSLLVSLSPHGDKLRSTSLPSSPIKKHVSNIALQLPLSKPVLDSIQHVSNVVLDNAEENTDKSLDHVISIDNKVLISKRERPNLRIDTSRSNIETTSPKAFTNVDSSLPEFTSKLKRTSINKIRLNKPLCLKQRSKKHILYAFLGTCAMSITIMFHIVTLTLFVSITSSGIILHSAHIKNQFIVLNILKIFVVLIGIAFTKYLWIPCNQRKVTPVLIKK